MRQPKVVMYCNTWGGIVLGSGKKEGEASQACKEGKQVFGKTTTLNAAEIGITLRVDEDALKTLDDIQEESIKAAQEHQKFAWR